MPHKLEIPKTTTLIAVSKKQPLEKIHAALKDGQRCFGENRVQEAYQHWENLQGDYADLDLHLIGPLQSNKAVDAVQLFDVIQTLDRKKIVDACANEEKKQGRKLKYFIQVNTGEEPQKSGVLPVDVDDLYHYANDKLDVVGLMCIPPQDEAPGLHFALLRKLGKKLNLDQLSMGMSADYKMALKFGATHVRIGSAFFGPRTQ